MVSTEAISSSSASSSSSSSSSSSWSKSEPVNEMSRHQRRERLQQLLDESSIAKEEEDDTADTAVHHDDIFKEVDEDEVPELFDARQRREKEEEADDRTANDEDEDDDDDDYDYVYEQVIRNNKLNRDKRQEYQVSNIITKADRTAAQQAQDLLYQEFVPNFWEGGISVTELIVELKSEETYKFQQQAGCSSVDVNDDALWTSNGRERQKALAIARQDFDSMTDHDTDSTDNTTTTDDTNKTECQSRVVFINQRASMTMEDAKKSVWLVKNKRKVVIYNFHVEFPRTMYPTLIEAQPILDAWRAYATEQEVPFFVSTILREPVGHALSFFNFFHVAVDPDESAWSPFVGDLEPTEENFVATYVPNRLCHIMSDDAHAILQAPSVALREGLVDQLHHFMDEEELHRRIDFETKPQKVCDSEKVREVLNHSFDYIGVTENITPVILPLIIYLAWGDASWADNAEHSKNVDDFLGPPEELTKEELAAEAAYAGPEEEPEEIIVPLKKQHLNAVTTAKIARESSLDQQLYEEYREKYAHWPHYGRIAMDNTRTNTHTTTTSTTSAIDNDNDNDSDNDSDDSSRNGSDDGSSDSDSNSKSIDDSKSSSQSNEL